MKKFLFLLASIILTTTNSLTTGPLINHNNNYRQELQTNNRNFNSVYRKVLSPWKPFGQEVRNSCAIASIQATVNYVTGNLVSQERIRSLAHFDPALGTVTADAINAVNILLREFSSPHLFLETFIPEHFAENEVTREQDLMIFQNFVTTSLNQNSPMMLFFNGRIPWSIVPESGPHCVTIIGIDVIDNTAENTMYILSETSPLTPDEHQIVSLFANEIPDLFRENPAIIASFVPNFDFENREISVNVEEAGFSGQLQNEYKDFGQTVDLTTEAGILNYEQLESFKFISSPGAQLKTSWFNADWIAPSQKWKISDIKKGKTPWDIDWNKSWSRKYHNIATAEFETDRMSNNWIDDKNHLNLDLAYQFYARVFLTTTYLILNVKLANTWIFSFK